MWRHAIVFPHATWSRRLDNIALMFVTFGCTICTKCSMPWPLCMGRKFQSTFSRKRWTWCLQLHFHQNGESSEIWNERTKPGHQVFSLWTFWHGRPVHQHQIHQINRVFFGVIIMYIHILWDMVLQCITYVTRILLCIMYIIRSY